MAQNRRGATPLNVKRMTFLRKRAGLSRRKLARSIGVTSQHIADIEMARTDPRLGVLAAIAHALGCAMEDLCK